MTALEQKAFIKTHLTTHMNFLNQRLQKRVRILNNDPYAYAVGWLEVMLTSMCQELDIDFKAELKIR